MKHLLRLLIVLLLASQLMSGLSSAAAQTDPIVEPAATETQAPVVEPTTPPIPTDVPSTQIPPTTEPTQIPPTIAPTEIPPMVAPTDIPVEATATATATSEPSPTPTPSPTLIPTPSPTTTEEPQFSAAAETITLAFSPAAPQVGNSFTAQASGVGLSGTITYLWWDAPGCPATGTNAGGGAVSGGIAPPSSAVTTTTAGIKSFYAYTGTLAAPTSNSPCTSVTVAKRSPTISISPSGTAVTAGSTSTSTSTLTGGYGPATGTVVYGIYPTNACVTATTSTAPLSLNASGVAPASGAVIMNLLNATTTTATNGVLYWKVVYSGDANNNSATSSCASKTVNKNATTLTHAAAPTTALTSTGSVRTASLGATSVLNAAGTVTYTLYAAAGCATAMAPPVFNAPTVVNGVVPNSAALISPTIGTRSANVVYSGDFNNQASTGACQPITFNAATPTLTLAISPTSIPVNGSATGTATLAAASAGASGNLTYTVYTNNVCSVQVVPNKTSVVTVVNAVAPSSASLTFTTAGQFYWRAVYAGDANNATASSLCVSFVVRTLPTLTAGWTSNPINAGGSTTATATLTGATGSAAGTVTYAVFSDTTCTTSFTSGINGPKTVASAVVPNSNVGTFAAGGPYSVRATYSGDTLNSAATSGCLALVVKAFPGITVAWSPNPVTVGAPVTATSTLTGATSTAAGTVTYAVFTNATCTTSFSTLINSIKTVVNAIVPASTADSFSIVGSYYVKATYSGDTYNNVVASACVVLTVNKAVTTTTVSVTPNPVLVGNTIVTSSTVIGGFGSPTGSVNYRQATDAACSNIVATNIKTLGGGIVPASDPATITTVGSHYVQAVYSGDAANLASTSPCLLVTSIKRSPVLTMTQSPSPVAIGGSFAYGFGLGATTGSATGNVTLRLYPTNACGTAIGGQTYVMNLSGGTVPGSPSISYTFSGTVYARADFAGDANHNASSTTCQAVNLLTGPITAMLSDSTLSPLPYSNTTQTSSGQLLLTVTDPRGTAVGWSVTVIAGPFVYSGTAIGQANLPASNFTLTGIGAPTTLSGQPIGPGGPVATANTGPLNASRTVIVASSDYGSGKYSHVLNVDLTLPGTTRAGTYTSTMTVTTAAAP